MVTEVRVVRVRAERASGWAAPGTLDACRYMT